MADEELPKGLIFEDSLVTVPVRVSAQEAFEKWFATKTEELDEILSPFGLSPNSNVAMPELFRIVREGDGRYGS